VTEAIRWFPIRHHGAGTVCALRQGLDAYDPDCVLVEGPPEAEPLLAFVGRADLTPPVALSVYVRGEPSRSATYPFASWSPEWTALCWAANSGVPSHFMDLSVGQRLAMDSPQSERRDAGLGTMATLGGFDSVAAWWDSMVESHGRDVFAAVVEAMTAVRERHEGRFGIRAPDSVDAVREAAMRQVLRTAIKAGNRRIAVVCGAWHVPALLSLRGVGEDRAVLRGLPRVRVDAAWIPWSAELLCSTSGYGAGVASPGWSAVIAAGVADREARWVSTWASALRDAGQQASAAQCVDAVQLAQHLCQLRERSRPSRGDLDDAIRAIFGDESTAVVADRVRLGNAIGQVPKDAPAVPLVVAVRAEQRRLRLSTAPTSKTLELDLRQSRGLEKSQLLHQLAILGVRWGKLSPSSEGALGTFREAWTIAWTPSCERALVAASPWGVTAKEAAHSTLVARSATRVDLNVSVADVQSALLAGLAGALPELLDALDGVAARTADPLVLLTASPGLARAAVYGRVRGTEDGIAIIADRLCRRGLAGMPTTAIGVDTDAAHGIVAALSDADRAVRTLADTDLTALWQRTLWLVLGSRCHPRIHGLAARWLFDAEQQVDVDSLLKRALSVSEPDEAAAWLQGFLTGSGYILVLRPDIYERIDAWLVGLPEPAFDAVLPALRRSFAAFSSDVRARLAQALTTTSGERAPRVETSEFHSQVRKGIIDWVGLADG
jgi:hypothetical protein